MRVKLCEWHPNYKAIRKPRNGCNDCWEAYDLNPNNAPRKIKSRERGAESGMRQDDNGNTVIEY